MEIKEKLIRILHNLGIAYEAGMEEIEYYIEDSVMFLSFIVEVEQEFEMIVSDEYLDIGKLNTLDDIVNMIIAEKDAKGGRGIV